MCTYERCRSESISCACGTPNCPTGDGQTSGCTKSDDICNEVDVLPFDGSSLANYQEGDVVRIGTQRFKCRDWPNGEINKDRSLILRLWLRSLWSIRPVV